MKIAKDSNTTYSERESAMRGLSTQEKRDEVWITRATDLNLDIYSRISAARNLSAAHASIKDEVFLEIAKDSNTGYSERESAMRGLSTQEKRDEVWITRATDLNLDIYDRIDAARNLSAAHNTIIRNKVLIQLYNEALNQGQAGVQLEGIVNAIQDPELQALAREALAAGERVKLVSTKSARKILSEEL